MSICQFVAKQYFLKGIWYYKIIPKLIRRNFANTIILKIFSRRITISSNFSIFCIL